MPNGKVKRIVKKVTSATCAIPGPWSLINLIVEIVVEVVNEIVSASITRQIPEDPEFAVRVAPTSLRMTSEECDNPGFPDEVNALQHTTINMQLRHAATLVDIATAVNRYYTALEHGSTEAAALQLDTIQQYFSRAKELGDEVAARLTALAEAIERADVDSLIELDDTRALQLSILTDDLDPGLVSALKRHLGRLDARVMHITEPAYTARQLILGIRPEEIPGTFSEILRAEAAVASLITEVAGPFPGVHFPAGPTPRQRRSPSGSPGGSRAATHFKNKVGVPVGKDTAIEELATS